MTSSETVPNAVHARQSSPTTWLQRFASVSACLLMLICACDGEAVVDGTTGDGSNPDPPPPTTCEVPADCALADTCVDRQCVPACAVNFQIDAVAILQISGCMKGDILDLEPNTPQLVPHCTVHYRDQSTGFEVHECATMGRGRDRQYLRDPGTDQIVPPAGSPFCFTIASDMDGGFTVDMADDLSPECAASGSQLELRYHPGPDAPPLTENTEIAGRCLLEQPPLPRECQDLDEVRFRTQRARPAIH